MGSVSPSPEVGAVIEESPAPPGPPVTASSSGLARGIRDIPRIENSSLPVFGSEPLCQCGKPATINSYSSPRKWCLPCAEKWVQIKAGLRCAENAHVFNEDACRDALVCQCGVSVARENLVALGYRKESHWEKHQQKFNGRANELADQCQVLRDENTELLAENTRLRRRLG
jgi:hypothetical protein